MLRRIVRFALHQPLFLFLILALFIGAGVYAFKTLSIEAFPDVTDVQAPVITLFPGHAAEEVEKQITIPLEIELAGLPHSIRMFSHTQFGLSFIYITFDDEVDSYFARQQVLERLQTAELPEGIHAELGALTTPVGEIYRVHLKGDGYSPTELRSMMDWVVSRQLKMIPGVADVVSRGGYIKQYQVIPDLTRMKSRNLSMRQLYSALQKGNANAGGGYIEQGEQQFVIRGVGLLQSAEDIRNVVVTERRSACPDSRHRHGERRRRASPGSGQPGRPGRHRDGNHPDAQGREPVPRAPGREGENGGDQRFGASQGSGMRAVL